MSHRYLDYIREKNKAIASRCHICKKQSTGINAYGYQIKFVCSDHFEAGVDKIIPNDIPGVHHVIYPNGLQLTKEQLNPNIGGWFGNKSKDETSTEPVENSSE